MIMNRTVAVFFADFLFGEIKRKSGGVRGAAPATKACAGRSARGPRSNQKTPKQL
jgi:hypothetical protein